MREIKFRGKRTDNGEWVEGYYYKAIKSEFIEDKHDDSLVCGGANAIVLCKNSPIGKRIKDISTLDFCPECLKAFDAFMNPLRQEVKDNG